MEQIKGHISLKKLKATTVSTDLNLLPVFTSIIAIASKQEEFALYKVLATLLVVGGLFLVTRSIKFVFLLLSRLKSFYFYRQKDT
ncbi:MAG: EamA family transporter [Simkania sp.]|nr:EamA family transporter [Simkania sp.]